MGWDTEERVCEKTKKSGFRYQYDRKKKEIKCRVKISQTFFLILTLPLGRWNRPERGGLWVGVAGEVGDQVQAYSGRVTRDRIDDISFKVEDRRD